MSTPFRIVCVTVVLFTGVTSSWAQEALVDEDQRAVHRVAFSPDSKTLASGGADNLIRIWDIEKKQVTARLKGHGGSIQGLAFLADGKRLVACDLYKGVKIWDLATKKVLKSVDADGGLYNFAVSPQGTNVYLGCRDAWVFKWDMESTDGASLPKLRSDNDVYGMAFTKDGRSFVHCDGGGQIYLWNTESSELIKQVKHGASTTWVAMAPDGKTFASGAHDGGVKLWKTGTAEEVEAFSNSEGDVRSICFSTDGKSVLIGTAEGHLKFLNAATGAVDRDLTPHDGPVQALATSPDGKLVATGCLDGTLVLTQSAAKR